MEIFGPAGCVCGCVRSGGDMGGKRIPAVETTGDVPDRSAGPPGTFRIGRGGSKGGGELFCAEQKVVQELQRRLGFLHIPQSGAQQPPAHQEGGVLRREPVGRGCLKRVCVQFVLERFLQWFQVVHGCLAQDIHKILCGEQLWRGTLFAGEHQFVLPLRDRSLNDRVPAAVQHQQITDQDAQLPLDSVGIRVAHAERKAALALRQGDPVNLHLHKVPAVGDKICQQVPPERGDIDSGVLGAVHIVTKLSDIAAQKKGAALVFVPGGGRRGFACISVGLFALIQIALQKVSHVMPVERICMVLTLVEQLEGIADDIQRVAQTETFLTGEEKIALHLFQRHFQQERDMVGLLAVAHAAVRDGPFEDGPPGSAGGVAAKFFPAQELQIRGGGPDDVFRPGLQVFRRAVDKIAGLCRGAVAFAEKLRVMRLDAAAQEDARRHVLAGAGQMLIEL